MERGFIYNFRTILQHIYKFSLDVTIFCLGLHLRLSTSHDQKEIPLNLVKTIMIDSPDFLSLFLSHYRHYLQIMINQLYHALLIAY